MKKITALVSLLVFGLSCAPAAQAPGPLKATTDGAEPAFAVPIVQVAGDGSSMGTAHGRQLGESIRTLQRAYFGRFFQNEAAHQRALEVAEQFKKQIAPEHLDEIRALAKSSQMDEREILFGQCFLDSIPMVACSTITLPASASPDHVARFGRNLDFPGFGVAEKATVLLVFKPRDRYAFASVSWPGMIGVLSGINEHGLTLCNMEVDRMQRPVTGMPYMLLYRTVLERCKTVKEAIELLSSTPRQTANNLMIMDDAGDRAVCEITPERVVVRRASEQQALISTNHHRGTDLDSAGQCRRFDYLHDTAKRQFGQIGATDIQAMLKHVAQGNMSIQSMIFEPANRVIYLASGPNAPTHAYGRLDLKPLLSRENP